MKLSDITPCPLNSELYPDSTSEAEIKTLALDIEARGLQYPAQICTTTHPDSGKAVTMLADGHRRYFAMVWLRDHRDGEDEIPVVDLGALDYVDVVRTLIASGMASRTKSIREQYLAYREIKRLLQEEHGNTHGGARMEQSSDPRILLQDIIKRAAKETGLTTNRAKELTTIFEEGSDETRAKLASGEMTVAAAYRASKKTKPKGSKKDSDIRTVSVSGSEQGDDEFNDLDEYLADDPVEAKPESEPTLLETLIALIDASGQGPQDLLEALTKHYAEGIGQADTPEPKGIAREAEAKAKAEAKAEQEAALRAIAESGAIKGDPFADVPKDAKAKAIALARKAIAQGTDPDDFDIDSLDLGPPRSDDRAERRAKAEAAAASLYADDPEPEDDDLDDIDDLLEGI